MKHFKTFDLASAFQEVSLIKKFSLDLEIEPPSEMSQDIAIYNLNFRDFPMKLS